MPDRCRQTAAFSDVSKRALPHRIRKPHRKSRRVPHSKKSEATLLEQHRRTLLSHLPKKAALNANAPAAAYVRHVGAVLWLVLNIRRKWKQIASRWASCSVCRGAIVEFRLYPVPVFLLLISVPHHPSPHPSDLSSNPASPGAA